MPLGRGGGRGGQEGQLPPPPPATEWVGGKHIILARNLERAPRKTCVENQETALHVIYSWWKPDKSEK